MGYERHANSELTITPRGVEIWFEQMAQRDLLFHPDDAPEAIVDVRNGERVFSDAECRDLRKKLRAMFEVLGDDIYDAAWPVFRRALKGMISASARARPSGPNHQL
jgi:hypothetical protein